MTFPWLSSQAKLWKSISCWDPIIWTSDLRVVPHMALYAGSVHDITCDSRLAKAHVLLCRRPHSQNHRTLGSILSLTQVPISWWLEYLRSVRHTDHILGRSIILHYISSLPLFWTLTTLLHQGHSLQVSKIYSFCILFHPTCNALSILYYPSFARATWSRHSCHKQLILICWADLYRTLLQHDKLQENPRSFNMVDIRHFLAHTSQTTS